MVNPLHVAESGGERLVFPDGAIELVIKIPGNATNGAFAVFEDVKCSIGRVAGNFDDKFNGTATNGAFAVFEDVVRPGAGPARHVHRDQEETFFVLDGRFDFEIDGTLFRQDR